MTARPTDNISPCSRETVSVSSADGEAGRTIITVAASRRAAHRQARDASKTVDARRTTMPYGTWPSARADPA